MLCSLDSPRDLANAALVSKGWAEQASSDDTWHSLYLKRWPSIECEELSPGDAARLSQLDWNRAYRCECRGSASLGPGSRARARALQ